MPSPRPSSRAGFTLLEVTLVVVIIFLLILALIPAFRSKRAIQRFPVLPPPTPTPAKQITKPSVLDLSNPKATPPPAPPAPEPPAPPAPM